MLNEEWRPVPIPPFGERYEVSNRGRVRNVESGKYLHGWPHSHTETPKITLNMRGAHRDFYTKELVWGAFAGELAPSYNIGNTDGDPKNITFENLFVKTNAVGIHPGGAMRKYIRTVDEFWDWFFAEHAPACYAVLKQRGA